MNILLFILLAGVIVAGVYAYQYLIADTKTTSSPIPKPGFDDIELSFRKNFNFLTPSEKKLYNQLHQEALEKDLRVFSKVRLEDLLWLPKMNWKKKNKLRSYVKSRHIDFVITDSECNILYCIELDDPSHKRADRVERDRKIDKILASAGIELKRISF